MTINKPQNLTWKQYWVVRNKNKTVKGVNKPQIGRWHKLRALERNRHCEECKFQENIERLENCLCDCHRIK